MVDSYFAAGIVVHWLGRSDGNVPRDEWSARADFRDGGHCQDDSTEGHVKTRYYLPLAQAIDVVKADIEKLGIRWFNPTLYYESDGENRSFPPPDGWRETLRAEAARIGFKCSYRVGD